MAFLGFKEYDFIVYLTIIHNKALRSFQLVNFVHIVDDKIFDNCLIGNTGNHTVDCLAAAVVKTRIFFYLGQTLFHCLDNGIYLANVIGHQGHVDRFWV